MTKRKTNTKLVIWSIVPLIFSVFLGIIFFRACDIVLNYFWAFNRLPQEEFEILVTVGIINFFFCLIAVTLIVLGFHISKIQVFKILKICSIIIIAFVSIVTVYSYSFIFSSNLDNSQIDLILPAFYSDKYLDDIGFINTQYSMETWSCIGKRDKFTWHIAGISFTDTMSLCLDTATNIKPCYFNYQVEMDSLVDKRFINKLIENKIKQADIEPLDLPNTIDEYYKIDDYHSLERIKDFRKNGSNTTYRVFSNNPENMFNMIEKIFIIYVNFLHN